MDISGAPVAYLAISRGVPVYDETDAQVGVVEHVLADENADIFHGLLIRAESGPNRYLFAARDQVAEMYEDGVRLGVAGADLHEPSEDAVAAEAASGSISDQARDGLRRAWEWLSQPR